MVGCCLFVSLSTSDLTTCASQSGRDRGQEGEREALKFECVYRVRLGVRLADDINQSLTQVHRNRIVCLSAGRSVRNRLSRIEVKRENCSPSSAANQ